MTDEASSSDTTATASVDEDALTTTVLSPSGHPAVVGAALARLQEAHARYVRRQFPGLRRQQLAMALCVTVGCVFLVWGFFLLLHAWVVPATTAAQRLLVSAVVAALTLPVAVLATLALVQHMAAHALLRAVATQGAVPPAAAEATSRVALALHEPEAAALADLLAIYRHERVRPWTYAPTEADVLRVYQSLLLTSAASAGVSEEILALHSLKVCLSLS
jgi:hypothetical protein